MAASERPASYRRKAETKCPICEEVFHAEEMFTGRGRLNAGNLTEELRRNYIPVPPAQEPPRPIIYSIWVCHSCLYAALPKDFGEYRRSVHTKLYDLANYRQSLIKKLFPSTNFSSPRNLESGLASYLLAISCYGCMDAASNPTLRRAVFSLRGAWLAGDLHQKTKDAQWDVMAFQLYQKAHIYYRAVLEQEERGKEFLASAGSLGPDIDQNFGYDGVRYLYAYLLSRFAAYETSPDAKKESYNHIKSIVGRVFGLGESSRSKPGPMLELARNLYENASIALGKMA